MKDTKDLEGKVLNIGDHYYTLHFQEDLDRRFERLGQCDLLRGKIWIDAAAPERPALSTLIHEVLEAIICNNTLDLKHPQIVVLENELFSFCMNNPEILEVLVKEAREKTGSNGVEFDDSMPPEEEVTKHIDEVCMIVNGRTIMEGESDAERS